MHTDSKPHYCITGGIGAGKSHICRLLNKRGISIYDCDTAAKHLMHTSPTLRQQLTDLIGPDTYLPDGTLNKAVVAQYLLASEANKLAINAIVHPAVMKDFYDSGLQWMESAIIFEAKLESYVDKIVCVTAPLHVRIERIMQRDSLTHDKAQQWVSNQTDQEEVARRSHYIIVNDGQADLNAQIDRMLQTIQ